MQVRGKVTAGGLPGSLELAAHGPERDLFFVCFSEWLGGSQFPSQGWGPAHSSGAESNHWATKEVPGTELSKVKAQCSG